MHLYKLISRRRTQDVNCAPMCLRAGARLAASDQMNAATHWRCDWKPFVHAVQHIWVGRTHDGLETAEKVLEAGVLEVETAALLDELRVQLARARRGRPTRAAACASTGAARRPSRSAPRRGTPRSPAQTARSRSGAGASGSRTRRRGQCQPVSSQAWLCLPMQTQ